MGACPKCREGATVIDLTSITGYAVGEKILGGFEHCGWVVLRGVPVTSHVELKLQGIASKGRWNSISTEGNRWMKYNYQSKVPVSWGDEGLMNFRSSIESNLLSKIPFVNTSYCIGKFKLLMNGGFIEDDQDPHFDYPPKKHL